MQMTLLFAGLSGQVKGEGLCYSLQGMAEEKAVSMSGERCCTCKEMSDQFRTWQRKYLL